MGLDTTHNCWHGGYHAFGLFRRALGNAAGYGCDAYPDYCTGIDLDAFEDKNFEGIWDTPPDDPLVILLVHSDCDGVIAAEHCPHLATRIEQLIPSLPEYQHATARQFISGLRAAADRGEPVEFL